MPGGEIFKTDHLCRNVSRTLTASTRTVDGVLSSKDHGLLICDAEVLLRKGRVALKSSDLRDFQTDVQDLINIHRGVDRQLEVLERIRWVYLKGN